MFLYFPFKKGAVIHSLLSLNLLDKSALTFLLCVGELPCRFRLVYVERIEVTLLSHQFSNCVWLVACFLFCLLFDHCK